MWVEKILLLLTGIPDWVVIVHLHDQELPTIRPSYGVGHLLGVDKVLLHAREWISLLLMINVRRTFKLMWCRWQLALGYAQWGEGGRGEGVDGDMLLIFP